MAMSHVRKGDQVEVLAGREKGKRGRVLRVYPKSNRVLIENVNMVKKHQRPGAGNRTGGIVEKEAPIHASNVLPIDPKDNKPTRTRVKAGADGKKVRVSTRTGAEM